MAVRAATRLPTEKSICICVAGGNTGDVSHVRLHDRMFRQFCVNTVVGSLSGI
jgi:hypothetical protein